MYNKFIILTGNFYYNNLFLTERFYFNISVLPVIFFYFFNPTIQKYQSIPYKLLCFYGFNCCLFCHHMYAEWVALLQAKTNWNWRYIFSALHVRICVLFSVLKSFVTPPPFLFFFSSSFSCPRSPPSRIISCGYRELACCDYTFFFLFFMRVLLALYQCKLFLSISVPFCQCVSLCWSGLFCHGESFTQRWLDLFSVCAPCFAKVLRVCGCVRVAVWCVCVWGDLYQSSCPWIRWRQSRMYNCAHALEKSGMIVLIICPLPDLRFVSVCK